MSILAIDPGTTESAWLAIDGKCQILDMDIEENDIVLSRIRKATSGYRLSIEMVSSYGMPVGAEVFATVEWIGRFIEAFAFRFGEHSIDRIYRPDIKMHLCRSKRAKDPHVRQALLDRFGPGREIAIGKKNSPGPLYGVRSHLWSALAVAVFAHDCPVVDASSEIPDASQVNALKL